MIHRGELLAKAIAKSQLKKTTVSKLLKFSTRYLYDLVQKESIPNDEMIRFGKALGYDFTLDLPELLEYMAITAPVDLSNLNIQFREKYYKLMEEHIDLIRKHEILMNAHSNSPAPSESSASKVRQKSKRK